MATVYAASDLQIPDTKDTSFSGSRIFSKLSKSPSRRHKGLPSVDVKEAEPLPEQLPYSRTTSYTNLPQPWDNNVSRHTLAPSDSSVSLNYYNEATFKASNQNDPPLLTPNQTNAMINTQNTHPAAGSPSFHSRPTTSVSLGTKQPMSFPAIVSEYYLPSQVSTGTPTVNYLYQQFHDLSNKRIATLSYMRKAHEGRLFWFNTVQFSTNDISRIPSYTPSRLSRRATNYFLLGLSIPSVLDVHPASHPNNTPQASVNLALDFMRSLSTLLSEFDSYQQLHPTDGSHVGSLSRARLPQMFKRTNTNRPRKSSAAPTGDLAAQISPPAVPETPLQGNNPSVDSASAHVNGMPVNTSASSNVNSPPPLGPGGGVIVNSEFPTTASFPSPGPADALNSSLLPNEGHYSYLLTPPLPFAPDFFTVFATLCDVLIDTYQKLLQIISIPSVCTPNVAELFSKTDAKIRKIMVGGLVRDFEHATRENAKREMNGVQKVVLGGLMGQ